MQTAECFFFACAVRARSSDGHQYILSDRRFPCKREKVRQWSRCHKKTRKTKQPQHEQPNNKPKGHLGNKVKHYAFRKVPMLSVLLRDDVANITHRCPTLPINPAFIVQMTQWGIWKKLGTLLDLCVSSLRRGHANLLCIVPFLSDDPRKESIADCRVQWKVGVWRPVLWSINQELAGKRKNCSTDCWQESWRHWRHRDKEARAKKELVTIDSLQTLEGDEAKTTNSRVKQTRQEWEFSADGAGSHDSCHCF